jgi:sugar/nucleoside kinase (ribokinase family)
MAGGSGINTATHLASIIEAFPFAPIVKSKGSKEIENENAESCTDKEEEEQMDVTLQTIVNQHDDYGRLLINHAKKHNFGIINCRRDSDNQQQTEGVSTGHCIVLVTQNERSFITHLGIMEKFQPSHTALHELVQCRSANPSFTNHHHHIHIAGYYNVPKFHAKNSLKKRIKLIREKRRNQSHGLHVYTTTVSLTPQYDATENWSTDELFNLLPLVDFLILNFIEACRICKISHDEENAGGEDGLNRSLLLVKMADYFDQQSPQTYVVVTLGKYGATLLYGGEVVLQCKAPIQHHSPVDTTGAGDAFVSGFLYGTMNWRRERSHNQVYEIGSVLEEAGGWTDAIAVGMKWGCAAGTACVMKAGASVPSSKSEIEILLHPEAFNRDEVVEDTEDTGDSEEEDYDHDSDEHDDEYDSELDSDYDPDNDYSDDDDYSSSYTESDDSVEDDDVDKSEEKKWI